MARQNRLRDFYGLVARVEGHFRLAAAVIAILGALPWMWYFLLRRIAELSSAIGQSTGDPAMDAALAKRLPRPRPPGTLGILVYWVFGPVNACLAKLGPPDEGAIHAPEKKARALAKIIVILGAIPSAWSFLLRRIAEVGAAFGGKPPTY